MKNVINLAEMEAGEKGKVAEIQGGAGFLGKLKAMGIVSGSEIIKVSAQLMQGPVTIRTGNTQIAIGYGMAAKIFVEVRK